MFQKKVRSLIALTVNAIIFLTACQVAPNQETAAITTLPQKDKTEKTTKEHSKKEKDKKRTTTTTTTPAPSRTASSVRLRVVGSQILTPEGKPIELRGVNWGWWGTAQPQDAQAMINMGANVVRMPFRWYFEGEKSDIRETQAPGHISPEGLKLLDGYIDWCTNNKIWVVLFAGSDQGAGGNPENYWTNPQLKKEFFETWEFLVERYKGKPYIAAYEILSEPHPKKPAKSRDLLKFYQEAVAVIRQHDQTTPVIIGPNDHYDINQLEDVYFKKEQNIIYTFNFYLPTEYVKTEKRKEQGLPLVTYPGTFQDKTGKTITLNKAYLATLLKPALDFRSQYNVPIFVNQVGVRSEAPGQLQYMTDVLDLFFQNHIPFTYWTYRTRHNNTQHGLYWMDDNGNYHGKTSQIEQLTRAFQRR